MITQLWAVDRRGRVYRHGASDDSSRATAHAWLFFDNEEEAKLASWFIQRVDMLQEALVEELLMVLGPDGSGPQTMKALASDPIMGLIAFVDGFARQTTEDLEQESREEIMKVLGRQGG